MNILLLATEARGMVSLGGLGEVVTSLCCHLKRRGHDVRLALPFYGLLTDTPLQKPKPAWMDAQPMDRLEKAAVTRTQFQCRDASIPVYLISGHPWFEQAGAPDAIYCHENHPEPYFFLCHALLRYLNSDASDWTPGVIHCHDMHAAMLPVYLQACYEGKIKGLPVGTVLTIHNLAYQGVIPRDFLNAAGLPGTLGEYSPEPVGMEYYGMMNCMKGGIVYSDITTTVSKTYAKEILTPRYGMGLDGVLKCMNNQGRLKGIVNGIDNTRWNPEKLERPMAFNAETFEKKKRAKKFLQKKCRLENSNHPVIAIRSRWDYQKGLELILNALRHHRLHETAQLIVLTQPEHMNPEYMGLFYELKGWAAAYPKRIAFCHSQISSELHNAGSDIFLMPSLFEPCGLAPLEAMRYGAVPIVHRTGGLSDTISKDCGFLFDWLYEEPLNKTQIQTGTDIMMKSIREAFSTYQNPARWNTLIQNSMNTRHDWHDRINEYENVYSTAILRANCHKN